MSQTIQGGEAGSLQQKIHFEENQLAAMEAELGQLAGKVDEWQEAIEVARARIKELRGGTFRSDRGEVGRCKTRIKRLQRELDDLSRPRVYWVGHEMAADYIVRKVTPKRIYIAAIGADTEDYYERDGSHRYERMAINIETTFRDHPTLIGTDETRKF